MLQPIARSVARPGNPCSPACRHSLRVGRRSWRPRNARTASAMRGSVQRSRAGPLRIRNAGAWPAPVIWRSASSSNDRARRRIGVVSLSIGAPFVYRTNQARNAHPAVPLSSVMMPRKISACQRRSGMRRAGRLSRRGGIGRPSLHSHAVQASRRRQPRLGEFRRGLRHRLSRAPTPFSPPAVRIRV